MTTYSWSAGYPDEQVTTGDWDDPSNWFSDVSGNPAGPPGAGDTADLTYATSITMEGETVGNISGSDDSTAGFS